MKFKLVLYLIIIFTNLITLSANPEDEGNSKNFKSRLNMYGVDLNFKYTADFYNNVSGGVETGSKFINQIHFGTDLILDKIFNINPAILHASFIGVKGNQPNDLVGSTQGVSNIETNNLFKLYDLWIDFQLNDHFSILAGLFDVNSEFDTKYNSGLFINPSHGIGAEFGLTGINGPSIYPNTSFGIRTNFTFGHKNYIKLGIFDAVPGTEEDPYKTYIDLKFNDGLLLVSEFGYDCYDDFEFENINDQCMYFAVGIWYFTNKHNEVIGTNKHHGNFGFYSFLESRLFLLNQESYLSGFIRTGLADNDVNQIDLFFSGGLVLNNYFFDEDQLGLTFASSRYSRKYFNSQSILNENPALYETNIELTYLVNITDFASIQPDIQYFINPSHKSSFKNSLCVGLRTIISF
ncbi:MAG: carbohydrate porin [Melioribacteraceae bacterium]|nr:carbohydrate porin [Melioribacteraceae bacterium]